MSRKYLLGATKDHEIVFGEFEITHRNGYPEFTASFNTVRPFTADELEEGAEHYQTLLNACYDDAEKYRLCERLNCCPSELAERMADENGTDPMDMRDCSLYPNTIDVGGATYYFESLSCGQHDTREEMSIYTSSKAYDRLHALWDAWHLKRVDDAIIGEVNDLKAIFDNIDEDAETWIADYIRTEMT